MKTRIVLILSVLCLVFRSEAQADKPKDAAVPAGSGVAKPSQAELEKKFMATLTKATLSGHWSMIQDGQLSAEKNDKYTITSVLKIGPDAWLINARIQYGTKNIVAPIPVLVKWAGDTAVIIVDKIPVPGSGIYSARVLIYEKTYAGTWSGGDHAGLLSGVITNE